MMTQQCVVVLGMHRSGTTMVAQILSQLGVYMGERFRPADKTSPWGYCEDLDWRDLNRTILNTAGGTWYRPPTPEKIQLLQDEISEPVYKRVESRNLHTRWGFKDPRTCLTIPILHDLLPNPLYIYVTRETDDIVSSLKRRAEDRGYTESDEHWYGLAQEYRTRVVNFLSQTNAPMYLVGYERFMDDPYNQTVGLAHMVDQKNFHVIRSAAEIIQT